MDITEQTPEEITATFSLKPFQGRQIFQWIHRRQVWNFDNMTDLSKDLRRQLAETCHLPLLKLEQRMESQRSPGTAKMLFRLRDGLAVESVVIRDKDRVTFCLSTQVGCAVRCAFCATGLSGFKRNLSAGEIVEQALQLVAIENIKERNPNIVYMGMGEPFRNYDAVIRSIRLLSHPQGLNIGSRRITVSTAGEIDGIRRFSEEGWQVRLSISLHAATDELRSQLVPLNRKYPLKLLMQAVRDYVEKTGRHVTFEWVLLAGVNDMPEQARALARLVRHLTCTVNLIPYNSVPSLSYRAPSQKICKVFRTILEDEGVKCTLRKERGTDIDAACGQLMCKDQERVVAQATPIVGNT
ncbi:MAG TPA: 23S rRNA (adenine(2503)-C(2))-methyltransferase RlmN [Candidatus Hydrogenedentes bacterium]|nr:23S rRNA (adenine(2503)-C(2))-methyltransferase RlmN [Candidatus Hydrogenedentota bacterium]HOL76626.1 23S rRNA (adenine(2503)-C(2))-methyltransferase RlmN [Candidatus Hydrogenedentota bacterium]HPO84459.1 23S rRNA (adenine(2503)-C(2))-methyltransferase RlmN [Candidatus Hydrogenedentota bacterium]